MSTTDTPIPPRLIDLMVEDATQGLSGKDKAELQAALANDEPLHKEAEAYALAATAVEVALTKPQAVEALPDALREKLIAAAPMPPAASDAPPLKLSGTAKDGPAEQNTFSFTDGRMFGWYAAAAALIALVLVIGQQPSGTSTTVPDPTPTIAEQYDALANDASTVTATWGFNPGDADNPGGDPAYANIKGEVIWNADQQTGYMKLAGLPVNDPTKLQYQLWIVDATRDTEVENTNRIDGGVFDITAQGETIVPIDAKLLARDAAAFAITVETTGGVVESKGPLQALAVVQKG